MAALSRLSRKWLSPRRAADNPEGTRRGVLSEKLAGGPTMLGALLTWRLSVD
jgi:hypothetical protein